ncbi:MAG: zinc-binding dehydrogenase [Phycisphaeraceae bacterium]|nr:MAG: zinc-binding dehydrogenase [Phycisphaeraceae bacterium]
MRALVITKQGTPVAPNVEFSESFPDPETPDPGEVKIRVLASALNHLDLWVGRGVPGMALEYPRVAGCDVCGVVEEVGEDVDEAWLGRRVIANAAIENPPDDHPDHPPATMLAPAYELLGEHHSPGAHAELFVCPVEQLADVGEVKPERAAAFGLSFLTAYSGLRTKADLLPGQTVLITGIGGGVALAALNIAKHLGCRVCVTSRHQWKLDRAVELGADHGVHDTGDDWSRDVRAWTGKRGVDVAFDSSGKATHLCCIKSLARGGAYVTPGCTSGPDATTDLARIFWNQLRILGSTMGSPDDFREVTSLLRSGALKPVIDSVHEAEEGRKAYEHLESGEQFGKVVIRWAE